MDDVKMKTFHAYAVENSMVTTDPPVFIFRLTKDYTGYASVESCYGI